MKKYKVFIASSNHLDKERRTLEEYLNEESKTYEEKYNIQIKPVLWETESRDIGDVRKQDEFNETLKNCDMVIFLFWKRFGKYTQEEFSQVFDARRKLNIVKHASFYFKDVNIKSVDQITNDMFKIIGIWKFLQKTDAIYEKFASPGELQEKIKNELSINIENDIAHLRGNSLTLPPSLNTRFLGRKKEIEEISKKLPEHHMVLLNGLGGMGKTEIAKQVLSHNEKKYDYIGWINYNGNLKESLVNDITEKAIDIQFQKEATVEERANEIIRKLSEGKTGETLLIIDNFDTNEDNTIFRLQGENLFTLITSRNIIENIPVIYSIEPLKKKECVELFEKYYSGNVEKCLAENIIELTGYHTLTIELLAKTAKASGYDLHDFYLLLKEKGFRIKEEITEKTRINWDNTSTRRSLFEHLKIVFDISGLIQEEKDILLNLSILPSTQLVKTEVKKWLKLKSLDNINNLIEKGWINSTGKNEIIVHNVIQEVICGLMEGDFEKISSLVKTITTKLTTRTGENLFKKRLFLDFGETIAEYCSKNNLENAEIADLCHNLSALHLQMNDLEKAQIYSLKEIENRKLLDATPSNNLANAYNLASLIYKQKGDFPEALEYSSKAIEIYDNKEACNMKALAISYGNRSLILNEQNEYQQALDYSLKALHLQEKSLDKNDMDFATSYNNLSTIYHKWKIYDKALDSSLKALEIWENNYPNNPNVVSLYRNIRDNYSHLGREEKAQEYAKKIFLMKTSSRHKQEMADENEKSEINLTTVFWDEIYMRDETNLDFIKNKIPFPEIENAVIKLAENKNKVLDFGCGDGTFLLRTLLLGSEYGSGVDLSPESIKNCEKASELLKLQNKTEFHQGSFEVLEKMEEDSFNSVILSSVLEYLVRKDQISLIQRIGKLLKSKGKVFLKTYDYASIQKQNEFSDGNLTDKQIQSLFENNFRINQVETVEILGEKNKIYLLEKI